MGVLNWILMGILNRDFGKSAFLAVKVHFLGEIWLPSATGEKTQ